jgi:hypothetical protein
MKFPLKLFDFMYYNRMNNTFQEKKYSEEKRRNLFAISFISVGNLGFYGSFVLYGSQPHLAHSLGT